MSIETVPAAAPHSRWRLLKEIDVLARGHDRAREALARYAAAVGHSPWWARWGPGHLTGWAVAALLAATFIGWASADGLRRVTRDGVPFPVAAMPGLLLTIALIGTAVLTANAVRRTDGLRGVLGPAALFTLCVLGTATWTALWLDAAVSAARGLALAGGLFLVLVIAASAFAAAFFGLRQEPVARPGPSRRLRRLRARAQQEIRRHERVWSSASHQTGALLADSPPARAVLLRLIDDREPGPFPEDLDTVHALVLAGLRDHRPRELLASLAQIDGSLHHGQETGSGR